MKTRSCDGDRSDFLTLITYSAAVRVQIVKVNACDTSRGDLPFTKMSSRYAYRWTPLDFSHAMTGIRVWVKILGADDRPKGSTLY